MSDSGDQAGSLTAKQDRVKGYERLASVDRATYLPFLVDAQADLAVYTTLTRNGRDGVADVNGH